MARLTTLTFSALVIFVGFGLPFIFGGYIGIVVGGLVILLGAGLFWLSEVKTRKSLEKDTSFNNLLKSDGENLIERSE